jgi:catechol 2,3-dioxygenase-like lactoylglutathione lyase family enzyme
MTAHIHSITFDCADPDRLAAFWCEALGYSPRQIPEGFESWSAYLAAEGIPEGQWTTSAVARPSEPGHPRLLFLQVPEGKVVKNRLHFDLVPESSMEAEVKRLEGLGARVAQRFDTPVGRFTVMHDPEGNEFCVETGPNDAS